jgi:hypothetical protein
MDTLNGFFAGRPCSTPHFAIEPSSKRKVQYIPLTYSAAALFNAPGGVETNRAHAIQVEIVGRAAETHTWSDDWLKFIGSFIADVVNAGVPVDINNYPKFYGSGDGLIASSSGFQRFKPDQWNSFNGVCGHQHVPENDHWDPGKLNIARVIEHANTFIGTKPPTTAPKPEVTNPMKAVYKFPNSTELWMLCSGYVANAEVEDANGTPRPATINKVTEYFRLIPSPEDLSQLYADGHLKPGFVRQMAAGDNALDAYWHRLPHVR